MYCVAEYPANPNEYESKFWGNLSYSISDHTEGLELYKKHEPLYYENHFVLKHGESDDPFGDSFCATESEIEEIL